VNAAAVRSARCVQTPLMSAYTHGARKELSTMIRYAAAFFVIAIIAAFFGYGGVASSATGAGKLFFIGFLVLAILTAISSLFRRSRY
jgi:uncharacterized membrane protein YtjA (UPF0391 family)